MKNPSIYVLLAGFLALTSLACGDDAAGVDASTRVDSGRDVPGADVATDSATGDTGPTDAGAADSGAGDAGEDVPPAADTWATFGEEFFATYCTECHNSGRRNYTTIDEVRRDADRIRCGTSDVMLETCAASPAPQQFPVGTGPRPDDEMRQRLVAWIDAGLAE